jgi:mannose-6-phosphate isomerase-like protein (cupin superfamily)
MTMVIETQQLVESGKANDLGYKTFRLGQYTFERNAYFCVVHYPGGEYHMPVGEFLRAVQRDIGWNFFYGMVKFDQVFGSFNFYDKGVDLFLGKYNDAWQKSGKAYSEMFPNERIAATFKAILEDWVPPDFNPWAAPRETGSPFGKKRGGPHPAIFRKRIVTKTMIKEPRTDATHPVNEMFKGLTGKDGEMKIKPEYKERFGLLNLYDYLARNDVTWNPEIVSAVEYSLFCPTTEEYILPITHGNDRVEWFLLLNGQISMEIRDRDTGTLRAYMHMKPGDCCAMPADISHNLWAPERSMLLVWENGNPELPELIRLGKTPTTPLQEFGLT